MLEFMLALAITALVAAAISGMMSAISTGERMRRDNRGFVVRSHAAKTRLSAYIAKSRCVLDVTSSGAVLWLDDRRGSGTVHASEIRWLVFDRTNGTLDVYFVDFPDEWKSVAVALEDTEYASDADWSAVWSSFQSNSLLSKLSLVDGLNAVSVSTDEADPLDSRQVVFNLGFEAQSGQAITQSVRVTIFNHLPPIN